MQEGTPIIIKKKKGGHGGHHGGAWKVAYADFVTAMMAFFMVMWIMGLSQETRAQIQGYFNDPFGFVKDTPSNPVSLRPQAGNPYLAKKGGEGKASDLMRRDVQDFEKLEGDLKAAISGKLAGGSKGLAELAKSVDMEISNEGLQINFVERTGEVFFLLGSDQVQPIARELILKVAPILAHSNRPMFIDGHTDARPFVGKNGYDNTQLSNDRSMAVYRLLVAGGVGEKQVMATRGFGSKHLRKVDDPFHFSNRRVTILLPFSSTMEQVFSGPKEQLSQEIEGVFRPPVNVAPESPQIQPKE